MGPHYIDYIDHTEWHIKLVEPWCHMCRFRLSCITPFTLEYLLCRITSCDLTPKPSPPRTHTMLLVINTDTLDVRWYHFNFLYQWDIHCCHEIFIVVIQKYEFPWLVRGFACTRTPFHRLFCARPWGPFFQVEQACMPAIFRPPGTRRSLILPKFVVKQHHRGDRVRLYQIPYPRYVLQIIK